MPPRIRTKYQETIVPKLKEQFGISNPMAVPFLEKVVLNIGVGKQIEGTKLNVKAKEQVLKDLADKGLNVTQIGVAAASGFPADPLATEPVLTAAPTEVRAEGPFEMESGCSEIHVPFEPFQHVVRISLKEFLSARFLFCIAMAGNALLTRSEASPQFGS
jgi:hypothetical protein